MRFPFPKDFLFGAASSAVQIESGCREGGKGEDIHNHNFGIHPEQYHGADLNDSADFYHRYPEDIQMMKELGLKTFRFSVSWSRIYPEGPDEVNPEGLAYYADIVDRLLDAGITPFMDLWHCDLPWWVAEQNGLLNPNFIDWFVDYAKTVFQVLGDKVPLWCTVNEPNINCMNAYLYGRLPPYEADRKQAIQACHNMIIAHYRTIRLYKEMGFEGQVSSVVHLQPCYAVDPGKPEDVAAAERYQSNYAGWWLDAMLKGHYPKDILEYTFIRDQMPKNYQQQLDAEFIPSDFIAINYYDPGFAKYEPDGKLDYKVDHDHNLPKDDYGFCTYPQGLFDAVMYLHNTYPGKNIIITENGIGVKKRGNPEEELNDDYRINHMREHLRSLSRAIQAGIPVKGYCHWSIMDTNELRSGGYDLMFGLTQVDYVTKERRPRKSWHYYQRLIRDGFVD